MGGLIGLVEVVLGEPGIDAIELGLEVLKGHLDCVESVDGHGGHQNEKGFAGAAKGSGLGYVAAAIGVIGVGEIGGPGGVEGGIGCHVPRF